MVIELYPHQVKALELAKPFKKVLFSLDLGLGKTFCCTEKMKTIPFKYALIVVPKSLVNQWCKHIETHYPQWNCIDFTAKKRKPIDKTRPNVVIVNYDLVFRRPELQNFYKYDKNWVLILDECVQISNDKAKRTKTIMKMKTDNLIMLSGSISKGKAENLYTLAKMLGANITKKKFYDDYIIQREMQIYGQRFPIRIITGYKNQEQLRENMVRQGTIFMRASDVVSLPTQTFIKKDISSSKEYKLFKKRRIVTLDDGTELVGDCVLSRILHERELCGAYSKEKLQALRDLLSSTDDRVLIFYNFWNEYEQIEKIVKDLGKHISCVNGKEHNMENFEKYDDCVLLINYASGSSGLNCQQANKTIYFSPPFSVEFWLQSAKRTNRLGQKRPCYYWLLIVKDSIEEHIYETLEKGKDYVEFLYRSKYGE